MKFTGYTLLIQYCLLMLSRTFMLKLYDCNMNPPILLNFLWYYLVSWHKGSSEFNGHSACNWNFLLLGTQTSTLMSSHSHPCFPNGSCHISFLSSILYAFLMHAMFCPFYPPWLYNTTDTCASTQIIIVSTISLHICPIKTCVHSF